MAKSSDASKNLGQATAVIAMLLFLGVTNVWRPWDQGISYSQARDVLAYELIAKSAPDLPKQALFYHYTQRFFPHYLVGLASKALGISTPTAYRMGWIALTLGVFAVVSLILRAKQLRFEGRVLIWAMFLMNPYFFRYYALVPGMAQDVVFVLGSGVLILGLVRVNPFLLWSGMLVATLGRQTALLTLPGVACHLLFDPLWKEALPFARRLSYFIAAVAVTVATYLACRHVGAFFALPGDNVVYIYGILTWVLSSDFKIVTLLDLMGRTVFPFLMPLGLLLGLRQARSLCKQPYLSFLVMSAGVAIQPFLAGPVSANNTSRLSALACIFLIVPIATALAETKFPFRKDILLGAVSLFAIGSFHHMYSVLGPSSAGGFAAMHVSAAILLLVGTRHYVRRS